MTQNGSWPKDVTLGVAREVRRWRKVREMSTERLSARCEELGSPIHRSVLANLESGRRENVTVADLVTLGAALGVPPLLLLYPVGREPGCEVMPGVRMAPWDAAKLFTGESAPADGAVRAAEDVGLFREHDRLVRAWERARDAAAAGELRDEQQFVAGIAGEAVLSTRARMRDRELLLPDVPAALAAVLPETLR